MKTPPAVKIRPANFDGFAFYEDRVTKEIVFNYFDDVTREWGPLPGDPNIPNDREAYHVLLTSVRKGRVHIEKPFTSTFTDAFVYAAHVARVGFIGIMIRKTQHSAAMFEGTLIETLSHHTLSYGFVMQNAQGVDVFYEGMKKEKSA